MTDTVTSMLQVVGLAEEGKPIGPGATSVALAIAVAEVSEIWRLPLTLIVLPSLSRRIRGTPARPAAPENPEAAGTPHEAEAGDAASKKDDSGPSGTAR